MQTQSPTLVYLAHLSWDHVWQRPQQLMTRFARHCRVIYVDPPRLIDDATEPSLQERPGVDGVRVLRPIFPTRLVNPAKKPLWQQTQKRAEADQQEATEGNSYQRLWLRMLSQVLAEGGSNIILWVSSPLADYLVQAARDQVDLVVYDCMDDLANFRDGTREMREREINLIDNADLLFTGGYSMYEARRTLHAHAFCFPSGVDVEHYRKVAAPSTRVPVAVNRIPQPRLGYFGVLDERIDWDLIEQVSQRRPDWHWLLVGPTAKVKRSELPVAANIHYLGKQPYQRLPAFLKGFDIATMPFALNEATRSISPTKTLEYLAGGKEVVSSSVPDVVAFYDGIVHLADGPTAWIEAVQSVLAATEEQHRVRQEQAADILAVSTWDSIVERMWALIQERLVPAVLEVGGTSLPVAGLSRGARTAAGL